MKTIPAILAVFSLLLCAQPAATAADAKAEMQALVAKVNAKLTAAKEGKKEITEAYLADEMKEFDTLLESHKSEKTDDVALIPFMKALLYVEIFEKPEKCVEILKQVKTDFPGTKAAENADKVLAQIAMQAEAEKTQKGLAVGNPFPDFDEKDLDGKPLSVANFKGKVVLVDFWATWCGPCVAELPNVLDAYKKYHDKGFEVIGISLDKDKAKLTSFIEERKMPWQQYFDGQGKLAQKYGIQSIPSTFLLDKEGKIIGKGLRGEDLGTAVAKALGQ